MAKGSSLIITAIQLELTEREAYDLADIVREASEKEKELNRRDHLLLLAGKIEQQLED